jgi:hypothetical protein
MDNPIENSLPVRGSHKAMRWVVMLVAVLAALLIGYALGGAGSQQAYERGIADGREQARQLLAETELLPSPSSNTVNGAISEITGNRLTVQVGQLVVNPLEQPSPEMRTVIVDEGTEITIRSQMSDEEINAAFEAFQAEEAAWIASLEENEDPGLPPAPPEPFMIRTGTVSDLEIGSSIRVVAAEDIALASEFTATTIELLASQPQPNEPPPVQ